MAVAGALIGSAIGAFGRKPDIPTLPSIDPQQVQAATIAANAQASPDIQSLAKTTNEFNVQQNLGMLSKALDFIAPGALAKAQGVINSQLSGEVPMDVAAAVQRKAAAQALLGGYGGGSGVGRNLSLRDFGLTSLQVQQQGLANFQGLAGLVPQTPLFNVSSMFFTPQQRLEAAFTERSQQFQRNLLAEQVAAAPDPATAALGREIDRFFNTAASIGVSAAGGAIGG